jgi:hypothetical protein
VDAWRLVFIDGQFSELSDDLPPAATTSAWITIVSIA